MLIFLLCILYTCSSYAQVQLGIDAVETSAHYQSMLKGKKIGVLTHTAAVNQFLEPTYKTIKKYAEVVCYFAPEHGLDGAEFAGDKVHDSKVNALPVYSLYGSTKRPTATMFKGLDLVVVDLQDIGSRSYTYITTLFYLIEKAAELKVPVMILDRPNPLGGQLIDGPMVDKEFRSFFSYVDVPYIHGMTICELAALFNHEYNIGCELILIPMKGWKREMTFEDTGLHWIPTSPHIPYAQTAFFYPMTGILGELQIVNIGVGYTLPFEMVGAPWIDKKKLADTLNKQGLQGVVFRPVSYKPFYGKFAKTLSHGIQIHITDPKTVQPVKVQFMILSILKSLHPKEMKAAIAKMEKREEIFCNVTGSDKIYHLLKNKKYPGWKMISVDEKKREEFAGKRKKYLCPNYN